MTFSDITDTNAAAMSAQRTPSLRSVSPRQAKAARAVLGLSVAAAAKRAGVSDSSIRRVEDPALGTATLDLRVRLQDFYEAAGLEFVAQGEIRGVHWREQV